MSTAPHPSPAARDTSPMRQAIETRDWSRTPLGPIGTWPRSLRTVVDLMLASRFAMWMAWGPELTFFCNDAYRPTLGDKCDFIGAPATQVWAEVWSAAGPRIDHVLRTGEATWDEGLQLFLERRGFAEETYHTFSYSPVQGDTGRIEGMLCVVAEVTERVLAERRMRTLAALSSRTTGARTIDDACQRAVRSLDGVRDLPFVAIYRIDDDANAHCAAATRDLDAPSSIATWPDAVRALIERNEAGIVDTFDGLLPARSEWAEPVTQAFVMPLRRAAQDARAGALFVAGLSPRLVLDDEYRRFLQLAAAQVATAMADAAAFEDQARRAEALAELDRAKTAFFSNVSHELRTPLTLILSPLDELSRTIDDADAQALLQTARRNGGRLQRMVNTLLDFSRIEAGRMQPAFRRVDVAADTRDLASMFRSAIERAGIAFEIDVDAPAAPVYLDRALWEKIVFNLLSNAYKFTLAGRIGVQLRDRGEHIELAVSDTGIGIAPQAQARLFERFYRVEGAAGRSIEGSGIGLALVQELARLHGGDVSVRSMPGEGSTFTVSIPTGRAHLPAGAVDDGETPHDADAVWSIGWIDELDGWLGNAPAVPVPIHDAHASPSNAPRYRVLIVDDNADMRAYLARLLSPSHEVVACGDGLDALARIHDERFDLVLSDVMMPGLDGFALLKRLREDDATRALPVILLSARAGDEARLEGLQAGADDYLTKPFQVRELLTRVQGVLQMAHARGEIACANDALRESESRHRFLAELGDATQALDDPQELLRTAMALLAAQLGLDRCVFGEVDPSGRVIELRGAFVADPALATLEGLHTLADFNNGIDDYRNGRAFVIDDVRSDPRTRDHADAYAALDIAANASFGLVVDDRLVAIIAAHQRTPRAWQPEEVRLIEAMTLRCWDALQRLRAQRDLTTALGELRVADRRKNEFIATLAHELRNPLAPLRTAVALLEHGGASDRLHGMMRRQIDHLVHLVDDLMEVSRISQGKIALRRERVRLQSVVEAALDAARPAIDAHAHRLAVAMPTAPLIVDADAVRLTQVLVNLLNNAAKYTARGGDIALELRRDGDDVLIDVRDTGIGIDAALLPHLFGLFVQGRHAESEGPTAGLGIGLALVRQLVELHGGRVTAQSEGPGRGALFRVRLPLEIDAEAASPVAMPTLTGAPDLRVLVCDDNRDAADSLRLLLGCSVDHVDVAYGGEALIDAVSHGAPDLVFLDLGMPAPDGYAVARHLRERFGSAPTLVALTGWGQPEDRERTARAGFDLHLVKPVDLAGLDQALALARRRREAAAHA